jgi:hypothetical protein
MQCAICGAAFAALAVALAGIPSSLADEPKVETASAKTGPLSDPNFFPVAVWLQNPANAAKYRDAGINLYVGLWKGPSDDQLAALKRENMYVICNQNSVGLAHRDDATIVGWMHGDEPDNAQALGRRKNAYGPPISPSRIVEDYRRIKQADPGRPVMLNLGQGVAWDGWPGRGVRTNHPEDYAEYVQGCDIASFDIYPACHDRREVAGKLWFVADGVSRLRMWSDDRKIVWNCIECTHIGNPDVKATPQQVKAEVWMSLIRGSRGLIYFVHEFKPKFIEAGLLADAEMLAQVTAINRQIRELAAVLNTPSVPDGLKVESSNKNVPVEAMLKRQDDVVYVFAVGMRDGMAEAGFRVAGLTGRTRAEVLGENRNLDFREGAFHDTFQPWDVHLYRIRPVESE